MGPTVIHGLPAHVLLVHAVVVLVPITVLLLLASTLWRGTHERIGPVTPVVALATLGLVPLTTSAGEWLQNRVPESPLVDRHAEMGDGLLPWVAGLFVLATVAWFARWRGERLRATDSRTSPGSMEAALLVRRAALTRAVIGTLAVLVSVGALVQVYRIGDSGAQAAWDGKYSTTATSSHEE